MSDIVWSIDPRRDDLASVIARVRQFALDLLEPQGIAFTVATPDGAERVRLGPEERRHLYLILKEAVNNIVKHSGASRATIAFAAEGPRLRVEVRDDGRGLSDAPAREAQAPPIASRPRGPRGGHGLENMAYRAAQMGGRLEIRPAPGGGTLIDLHLPLRHGG
jgi:signal transduction histidine kinase